MAGQLSEAEVQAGLAGLRGWSRDGDALVKAFKFGSYLEGLAFAAAVGVVAEGRNHHPDMVIGWRSVSVSFSTHDVGGKITAKDVGAAAAVDALGYPR